MGREEGDKGAGSSVLSSARYAQIRALLVEKNAFLGLGLGGASVVGAPAERAPTATCYCYCTRGRGKFSNRKSEKESALGTLASAFFERGYRYPLFEPPLIISFYYPNPSAITPGASNFNQFFLMPPLLAFRLKAAVVVTHEALEFFPFPKCLSTGKF